MEPLTVLVKNITLWFRFLFLETNSKHASLDKKEKEEGRERERKTREEKKRKAFFKAKKKK